MIFRTNGLKALLIILGLLLVVIIALIIIFKIIIFLLPLILILVGLSYFLKMLNKLKKGKSDYVNVSFQKR